MRALVIEEFGRPGTVREIDRPDAAPDGAVIRVAATGVCRSDWHAWQGHDGDVRLPFVPGHEFAGTVVAVGADVDRDWIGRRVTTPFVCACGSCPTCAAGDHQVCPRQEQPGFTHDGSYAEFVAVRYASTNLIALPDEVSFDVAATLGCRYATAWRAVHRRARVVAGERVAVYGCGGLGLSAVIIASGAGAEVTAVDRSTSALNLARRLGAARTVQTPVDDMHVALECSGHAGLADEAIRGLRRRGRHVQIGLLPGGGHVSMDVVIAREIDVLGSHGLAAHEYPELLRTLPHAAVESMIGGRRRFEDAQLALDALGESAGVTLLLP
ncbi:alcohol dehydrogenase catalytic domain-containing protein [Rhodococcus sp. BP-316]|uniref:alcohol dehydrogenase catalytic domain-containing protein n=1 Tax=Rhodococcus sp. BP-316 TaxID=2739445 RepID=UPI001C9AE506|nr:alcohol dehydrogenase catalytic domain-containing protein [Rhodococcus sp. BP-316]MBY6680362.1 alcohol dehydrogenase catalytic domain-containing protein [Rhodococcus sp. BP-316]